MPELNFADVLALINSAEDRRLLYQKVQMYDQAEQMAVIIAKLEAMRATVSVY